MQLDITFILIVLTISFSCIYLFQKIFFSKNIIDKINDRSSHSTIATRSGGLAIFFSIFIISCFYYVRGFEIYDFSIIVPLSLLMVVGLYDDIYSVDFKLKFIFQIIAAKVLIDNGLIIDNLHGVFGIYELGRIAAHFLTIFIIVAIINSINFIDGIDGLALLVVFKFIIMFEYFAAQSTPFVNLTYLIVITALPLLFFNFKKNNKVFLGDSGSLVLGGLVSSYVIYILSQDYLIKPEFDLHKIIFVLTILFFPIVDIVRVFFVRIFNGKSPFEADKNHIHHLILNLTKSHYKTTLVIILTSFIFLILTQILIR